MIQQGDNYVREGDAVPFRRIAYTTSQRLHCLVFDEFRHQEESNVVKRRLTLPAIASTTPKELFDLVQTHVERVFRLLSQGNCRDLVHRFHECRVILLARQIFLGWPAKEAGERDRLAS